MRHWLRFKRVNTRPCCPTSISCTIRARQPKRTRWMERETHFCTSKYYKLGKWVNSSTAGNGRSLMIINSDALDNVLFIFQFCWRLKTQCNQALLWLLGWRSDRCWARRRDVLFIPVRNQYIDRSLTFCLSLWTFEEIALLYSCGWTKRNYDEVFSDINDAQSKISLNIIDYITKFFANFAKTG